MRYLSNHETAPGYRVVLWQDASGTYHVESQEHISVTSGSLPWEFNRDGWRACTGCLSGSSESAMRFFKIFVDQQREYINKHR